MITVVALNPALDITHQLAGVDWAGVNRPDQVLARPGGKGLNVARTLLALRAEVQVLGLVGGVTGAAVRSRLAAMGVPDGFTDIEGETRRTFAVVDAGRGQTALFNEPGPRVSAGEYRRFLARYTAALPGCAVVVLTGSLPRGLPDDCYAELAALAEAAGRPVLLDADGQALRRGAAGRPAIVKPNLAELERAVGRRLAGGYDLTGAAGELISAGAQAVVVSLGADGLLAVTAGDTWRAATSGRMAGNPTGAGDAVVAGLAHGLVLGRPWEERLRHAVALGAAAAAAAAAGEFLAADYHRELAGASVSRGEES